MKKKPLPTEWEVTLLFVRLESKNMVVHFNVAHCSGGPKCNLLRYFHLY
jgi:hypothetical protein